MLNMIPEKHEKTSELSKHWSPTQHQQGMK